MYKSKSEKGITLIALIITIIILLILAGITISALTNQGLFAKSKSAKTQTEIGREIEQIKLTVMTVTTNNYASGNLPFSEFEEEMVKYKDVENVTQTDNINSATLVSKSKKKFDLLNYLMPISNAVDTNEGLQYAKVEYKTKRIYYVKLRAGSNQSGSSSGSGSSSSGGSSGSESSSGSDSGLPGSIYEDPNNRNTEDSQGSSSSGGGASSGGSSSSGDDTSDEDLPSATKSSWFVYDYFNANEYLNMRYSDKNSTEELKNYLEQNNWEYSIQEDYLAANNYNGYIIYGFSDEGKEAILNGTLKNTMYIPSKYDDGEHGEANVIALGERNVIKLFFCV